MGAPPPSPNAGLTIVGRIRRAHGIRGEVLIEPLTDEPDALFASGRRVFVGVASGAPEPDPQHRTLQVTSSRPFKEGLLVVFAELTDRTIAERWRDRYLLVPSDELTPPGDNEVYQHELVGMRVELPNGAVVGTVEQFYELPQGLLLEVRRAADTVLIPYRTEIVQRVHREEKRIVVDPPAGLLD